MMFSFTRITYTDQTFNMAAQRNFDLLLLIAFDPPAFTAYGG